MFSRKSAVAGILDRGGGLRVVVTKRWRMKHHVGPGERLFIVPGLRVREPVSWGAVPALMRHVCEHMISNDPSLSYLRQHVAVVKAE